MRAQQPIALERNQRHVGKPCTVLLEELLPDGRWQGRTAFQAPLVDGITKVSGITGYGAGQFVQVRITAADTYDLEGVYTP
jgi:ribosomal protein S12 methylthiotransferase